MNSSRVIEGATLMSIGVFCASALLSFALHSAHAFPSTDSTIAMVELPTVTISAKRLNAAEKASMQKSEQTGSAKSMTTPAG